MSTPGRKRGRDVTGTGRASGKTGTVAARRSGSGSYISKRARQGGERFSAGVVLVFILATTMISIYDLYLLLDLMVH